MQFNRECTQKNANKREWDALCELASMSGFLLNRSCSGVHSRSQDFRHHCPTLPSSVGGSMVVKSEGAPIVLRNFGGVRGQRHTDSLAYLLLERCAMHRICQSERVLELRAS